MTPQNMGNRWPARSWLFPLSIFAGIAGCTSPLFLSSPAPDVTAEIVAKQAETPTGETPLIRDLTTPWGLKFIKLESVAMVTGLEGTGSDPPPSAQRQALIGEMHARDVKSPNSVLASPDTAMVITRVYLPPGVQKGDRVDVEVRAPTRSDIKSLRGGWLMQCRLREMAYLDSAVRVGRVEALGEGPVLIDAAIQGDDDPIRQVRGRVLGGGVSMASRPLGLAVRGDFNSVRTSSAIGSAINTRFYTFDRGIKKGVATPKRDNYVELEVHPRYKHNISRYVRVVQAIAYEESPTEKVKRLELLGRMIQEPATAADAALQLEAIGKEGISKLKLGLKATDPEVAFYAAEALAYLDQSEAAETLQNIARDEPAFRWHAIAALTAMDNAAAYDALSSLLHVPSAETRYAAFRALRTRNPMDPLVHGTKVEANFRIHTVSSDGPPMIHFSGSRRPEMVLFGADQRLHVSSFIYAGPKILLKAADKDRIKVVRYTPGKEDKEEICGNKITEVAQAIIAVGGDYEDVLEGLREAKKKQYIDARVVVDALPRAGRTYRREEGVADGPQREVASPLPEMFASGGTDDESEAEAERNSLDGVEISPPEEDSGFVAWLNGWFDGEDD